MECSGYTFNLAILKLHYRHLIIMNVGNALGQFGLAVWLPGLALQVLLVLLVLCPAIVEGSYCFVTVAGDCGMPATIRPAWE
jgi:hypothetical protein